MELKVKKAEQGPVLAKKGDVGVNSGDDGGYGGIEIGTSDNSSVTVGGSVEDKEVGATYRCSF